MDILFLVGRVLFGGYFVMGGLNHFMKRSMMVQYSQSKGVPAPGLAVAVGGILMILGGLSVLFGAYLTIGLWLLIIFLLTAAFLMHNFWAIDDPQMKMAEMSNFMRNLGLVGAALMMMLLTQPWSYALNI